MLVAAEFERYAWFCMALPRWVEWSVWHWCRRDAGASSTNYHGNFIEHSHSVWQNIHRHWTGSSSSCHTVRVEIVIEQFRTHSFSPPFARTTQSLLVIWGGYRWSTVIFADFAYFALHSRSLSCYRTLNLSLFPSLFRLLVFAHNNYVKTNENLIVYFKSISWFMSWNAKII